MKFTYTDEAGAPQSAAAVYDASSKTYKADLSALKIKGKTQVEFILESPAAGVEIKDQYVIGNTVTIASTTNGTVNRMSGASGSTAFAFGFTPREGYTLDTASPIPGSSAPAEGETPSAAGPWVTYQKRVLVSAATASAPAVYRNEETNVPLSKDTKGNWYIKPGELEGLAPGSDIVIHASFIEDAHAVTAAVNVFGTDQAGITPTTDAATGQVTYSAGTTGKVVLSTGSARTGDTVEVTATATSGSAGSVDAIRIEYSYTEGTEVKSLSLTADASGKASFVMPAFDVTVKVTFTGKNNAVTAASGQEKYIDISTPKATVGDTVTVSITDEAVKEGKVLTGVRAEAEINVDMYEFTQRVLIPK